MEAWKDELYHYGIKGMKWRKRHVELASRGYEAQARHTLDARDQALDTIRKERQKGENADIKEVLRQTKYVRQQAKRTKRAAKGVVRAMSRAAFDEGYEHGYNRTKERIEQNRKKRKAAVNKVKSAAGDTKKAAKSYVRNLFKRG